MKKLFGLFASIFLSCIILSCPAFAGIDDNRVYEFEDNNTLDYANAIYNDETMYGYVDGDDIDVYRFFVKMPTNVALVFNNYSSHGMYFDLVDENDKIIPINDGELIDGTLIKYLDEGVYYLYLYASDSTITEDIEYSVYFGCENYVTTFSSYNPKDNSIYLYDHITAFGYGSTTETPFIRRYDYTDTDLYETKIAVDTFAPEVNLLEFSMKQSNQNYDIEVHFDYSAKNANQFTQICVYIETYDDNPGTLLAYAGFDISEYTYDTALDFYVSRASGSLAEETEEEISKTLEPVVANFVYLINLLCKDETGFELYSLGFDNINGTPIKINRQPYNVGLEGETFDICVEATGDDLTYQWYYYPAGSGYMIKSTDPGNNTNTLTIPLIYERDGYAYVCLIEDSHGKVITSAESLYTHVPDDIIITKQPESIITGSGQTKISVEATGNGLWYYWMSLAPGSRVWKDMPDETNYINVNINQDSSGYKYKCVVFDYKGNYLESNTAKIIYDGTNPLRIISNPESKTVTNGEKVTFSVGAEGDNLKYQWQYSKDNGTTWTNSSASNGQKSTLTVTARTSYNGYLYRCKVTSGGKTDYSAAATLTVKSTSSSIIAHPEDVAVKSGSKAVFSVETTGNNPKYQWQYSKDNGNTWTNSSVSIGQKPSLTVTTKTSYDGYLYRCKVTDGTITLYSKEAKLSVVGIKKSPSDVTVHAGEKAKFTVSASGSNISYQWYYRKNENSGWRKSTATSGTSPTLSVTAKESYNGYQYSCKVTDGENSAWSKAATLNINSDSVSITSHPLSMNVKLGDKAIFKIEAKGNSLTYQWQYRKNESSAWANSTVSCGKTDTLYVTARESYNNYQYRCKVTDGKNSVVSDIATLNIFGINQSPDDVIVAAGKKATFTIDAVGNNISYQWQYSKNNGSTWNNSSSTIGQKPTLTVTAKTSYNGYLYRCKVTIDGNTLYSDHAILTVK